jgi:hypothetical protein
MKKFSSISGEKVNSEPKIEVNKEELEFLALKASVIKLMDSYLSIRSYGSARTELFNNSVKISGKEMFAEALIEFLSDKTLQDQIKTVESLKSENKDWKSIDNKVNNLYDKINDISIIRENANQVKKIKAFLETYGEDEKFDLMLDIYTKRIIDGKEAYLRSLSASKMIENNTNYSKEKLSRISEKFLNRAKELGF